MLGRERRELAELLCQASMTRGKGLRKLGASARGSPGCQPVLCVWEGL